MEVTGTPWIDGLIYLLTGSGGVFSFFKWLLPFIEKMKKNQKQAVAVEKFDSGLRAILDVSDSIEELRMHNKITRVILLEISDSGDLPQPGCQLYATAIEIRRDGEDGERNKDAERRLRQLYTRISLDEAYIQMLVDAQKNSVYKMVVAIERDCMLKDFYINERIKYSEVYHIFTDGLAKKQFIMSIATDFENEQFDAEATRAFINTSVQSIRSNFKTFRLT